MRTIALLMLLAAGLALAADLPRLEDHFNRPFSDVSAAAMTGGWTDALGWHTARFAGLDDPGKDPLKDPKSGAQIGNPWMLSYFPGTRAPNRYWWQYRGHGPSWCVSTCSQRDWADYAVQAAVLTEFDTEVGLIAAYQDNGNFLLFRWKPAGAGNRAELVRMVDGAERVLAASPRAFEPRQWYTLGINLGAHYVEALVDGVPLLRADIPDGLCGLVGLYASSPAAARSRILFDDVRVRPLREAPPRMTRVRLPEYFAMASYYGYCAEWARPASEWWPATNDGPTSVQSTRGPAIPFPTDRPGLYWHKGMHFGDVRVYVPASAGQIDGQALLLTSSYEPDAGYRLTLERDGERARARLLRRGVEVAAYSFVPTRRHRLMIEREGGELVFTGEALGPEVEDPRVWDCRELGRYHDPDRLPTPTIGFVATTPALPAADVLVETDGLQDAFEEAPVNWVTDGQWMIRMRGDKGVYSLMGSQSTDATTLWSKHRLDGDQMAEAFYWAMTSPGEEPTTVRDRNHDFNLAVCADGIHPDSGYALLRATLVGGKPVTRLLRNGVPVWESTEAAHLLPPHMRFFRAWFPTRIEKRGAEIKVFLDNRLATTYVDPDPLPGGHVAIWTRDNGVMIARANLFAERMTLGAPHAWVPPPAIVQ